MDEGPAAPSVYDVASRCLNLFKNYVAYPTESQNPIAHELQSRFNLWAAYTGAFADDDISLDNRLLFHQDVKCMVLKLLFMVERNLSNEIRHNADHQKAILTILKPLDAEGRSDFSKLLETTHGPFQGLAAVSVALDRLHRLATAIRRSSLESRKEKLITKIWDTEDETYLSACVYKFIQDRFPSARASLLKQLTAAVCFHRKRLVYQPRHNQKLQNKRQVKQQTIVHSIVVPPPIMRSNTSKPTYTGLENAPSRLNHKLPMSTTDASIPNSLQLRLALVRAPKPSLSIASTGSTIHGESFLYPDAPSYPDGEMFHPCPYCSESLPTSKLDLKKKANMNYWRAHIDQDLEPYFCISEECRDPLKFFVRYQDWSDHMQKSHTHDWHQSVHMLTWYCGIGHQQREHFTDKSEFEKHTKQYHPNLTASQLSARAKKSKIIASRDLLACPLCEDTPARLKILGFQQQRSKEAKEALNKHVAFHLKALSLLSFRLLPCDHHVGNDDIAKTASLSDGRLEIMTNQNSGPSAGSDTEMDSQPLVFQDMPHTLEKDDDGSANAIPESRGDWAFVSGFEHLRAHSHSSASTKTSHVIQQDGSNDQLSNASHRFERKRQGFDREVHQTMLPPLSMRENTTQSAQARHLDSLDYDSTTSSDYSGLPERYRTSPPPSQLLTPAVFLDVAHAERRQNFTNAIPKGRSPFREGSRLAPVPIQSHNSFSAHSEYDNSQNYYEPKTISPKDALLDFGENDDFEQAPLFPEPSHLGNTQAHEIVHGDQQPSFHPAEENVEVTIPSLRELEEIRQRNEKNAEVDRWLSYDEVSGEYGFDRPELTGPEPRSKQQLWESPRFDNLSEITDQYNLPPLSPESVVTTVAEHKKTESLAQTDHIHQPQTSNEAMRRYMRIAENYDDNASIATIGSRRLSESDLQALLPSGISHFRLPESRPISTASKSSKRRRMPTPLKDVSAVQNKSRVKKRSNLHALLNVPSKEAPSVRDSAGEAPLDNLQHTHSSKLSLEAHRDIDMPDIIQPDLLDVPNEQAHAGTANFSRSQALSDVSSYPSSLIGSVGSRRLGDASVSPDFLRTSSQHPEDPTRALHPLPPNGVSPSSVDSRFCLFDDSKGDHNPLFGDEATYTTGTNDPARTTTTLPPIRTSPTLPPIDVVEFRCPIPGCGRWAPSFADSEEHMKSVHNQTNLLPFPQFNAAYAPASSSNAHTELNDHLQTFMQNNAGTLPARDYKLFGDPNSNEWNYLFSDGMDWQPLADPYFFSTEAEAEKPAPAPRKLPDSPKKRVLSQAEQEFLSDNGFFG